MAKDKWTETEVFKRLPKIFAPPAYVWLPQVRNGTGYARRQDRTADAIGVSVWPSRGLYFLGVEIKVSRSDWRHELANPSKAAEWEKYCRYWYVAAPRGVVPVGEVPETWGLIEVTAAGAEVVQAAPQRETKPPDMLLTCSILRAVAEVSVPADDVKEQVAGARADATKNMVPQYQYERLQETVAAFETESGLKLGSYDFESRELGKQVRFLQETGIERAVEVAKGLRQNAEQIVRQINAGLEKLSLAPSPPQLLLERRLIES